MTDKAKKNKYLDYKTDIRTRFGEKVRALRLKQKKFIGDIAHEADLSESYLGMIERGERNISLDKIEDLAKALKVKIIDLFDF